MNLSFDFKKAQERLKKVVLKTPLQFHQGLSDKFQCKVYLKREDLQIVRSYKLRGAYNMISSLSNNDLKNGVVCASAGNHAQGFAFSCKELQVKGTVFMPVTTPKQKVNKVRFFGEQFVDIMLVGDTFDECLNEAQQHQKKSHQYFIPPFDHPKIIEGQATVALEVFEDLMEVDCFFVPVGGGGLAAGIISAIRELKKNTQIIGVEALGAPSLSEALKEGEPVTLLEIDKFVDGVAVKRIGEVTFPILKSALHSVSLIHEGKICSTILELYNQDAIVVEPAGALSIAALEDNKELIKGKVVVCVISGSNNDIDRMQEIKERSLLFEGLKHYFLIRFPQRPGALRNFLNNILGVNDDITRFEFVKKNSRETGPALVGIELKEAQDYAPLIERLKEAQIDFKEINSDPTLFEYLV